MRNIILFILSVTPTLLGILCYLYAFAFHDILSWISPIMALPLITIPACYYWKRYFKKLFDVKE